MNKLFLITWRWLKKDKKRTALTFGSIVLAVYLISFVGVYISTALSSYRASVKYESPYHSIIYLNDTEQADTLNKNVAWESHCLYINKERFMGTEFMNRYADTAESLFPIFDINGKNVYSDRMINAAIMDGQPEKTINEHFQLTGELPKGANEVAVSQEFASKYGDLKIGDTITIKLGTQKGTLYYAEAEDLEKTYKDYELIRDKNGKIIYVEKTEYNSEGKPIGEVRTEPISQPIRDDNGNIIYKEDTDGSKLKEIYGHLDKIDSLIHHFYLNDSSDVDYKEVFTPDYSANGHLVYEIPPGYAVLSGEKDICFEYTATVTGLAGGGIDAYGEDLDILFSPHDSAILPYFEDQVIDYYVRVKPGVDAEDTIKKALEGIGVTQDPNDVTSNSRYLINNKLLVLEGRQLEYISDLGEILIFAVIIIFLFVFLARLIINNAFEISAAYRTEQYGALKTIGASDKQLFVMVMFECSLYMLTALPVGFFGAVGTGKLLISKIQEIGVFDPYYGEGVSKSFFTLDLSPTVMIITFAIAAFSIFFSSYADAMRVRRMPPIRSVGYSSMKKVRNKRSLWISRKLGYHRAFAIKCISKQKVRFTITLFSAVMSGIFIMAFAGVASIYFDAHPYSNHVDMRPDMKAIDDYYAKMGDKLNDIKDDVKAMSDSGYFTDIIPEVYIKLYNNADTSGGQNDKYYSEQYRSFVENSYSSADVDGIVIQAVTREMYDKYITADMTYDEFVASGKVLLCNSVGARYNIYEPEIVSMLDKNNTIKKSYIICNDSYCYAMDIDMFNTKNIDALEFTGTYQDGNRSVDITEHIEVGGFYETDNPYLMFYTKGFKAIIPLENITTDMFECQKQGFDPIEGSGINMFVKDGCIDQASMLTTGTLSMQDVYNYFAVNRTNKNLLQTVKIAGYGVAISLAAVVLLNIFSTMSANMINRRRDFNMMRSCGMSVKQVRKSMFAEARIYAIITTIAASVIGWVLAVFTNNLFFDEYNNSFDFDMVFKYLHSFPWLASILVFAVIMLAMSLAIIPSLISMKKHNIAQEMRTDL